jgi:ornithine cyclodeaminase/alanine dehydrogenase-like protein (mu-crystallin family)
MDDVSAAKHVYDNAISRGLGTRLRLRTGPPVWE